MMTLANGIPHPKSLAIQLIAGMDQPQIWLVDVIMTVTQFIMASTKVDNPVSRFESCIATFLTSSKPSLLLLFTSVILLAINLGL